MTKTTSAAYAAAGQTLLTLVESGRHIPYTAGGMGLSGMDCQGLCEYLLTECGVPAAECNLAGSNAHWRGCVWRGTPEECAQVFGRVPEGAWVFIVDTVGGGEVARGYTDGLGDAYHMGVVLNGCALHASASRGCVARSAFEGATVPNGGWNAIGLPAWVDYGDGVNAVLAEATTPGTTDATNTPGSDADDGLTPGTPVPGTGGAVAKYATVVSPDGNPVKLRKSAGQQEKTYWKVNPGARVRVERVKGDWSLITAICADGYKRRAYMLSAFLRG